jgi:hypothetical protein
MTHTRRWSQEESRVNVCRAGREERDRQKGIFQYKRLLEDVT